MAARQHDFQSATRDDSQTLSLNVVQKADWLAKTLRLSQPGKIRTA